MGTTDKNLLTMTMQLCEVTFVPLEISWISPTCPRSALTSPPQEILEQIPKPPQMAPHSTEEKRLNIELLVWPLYLLWLSSATIQGCTSSATHNLVHMLKPETKFLTGGHWRVPVLSSHWLWSTEAEVLVTVKALHVLSGNTPVWQQLLVVVLAAAGLDY